MEKNDSLLLAISHCSSYHVAFSMDPCAEWPHCLNGGSTWAQQYHLLSKAHLVACCTVTPERLTIQEHRPTLGLPFGTIPRRNKPATCWFVDYIGQLPSWKKRSLYWDRHIFWYGFAFLAYNTSATIFTICSTFLLIKEHISQQKKCSNGLMTLNSLVTPHIPPPRSIWPNKIVEWLTQDSVSLKTISWKKK